MRKIPGISGPDHIQTKQLRIARLAKESPERVLTSLAHYIDEFWMYEAYRRTKKGKATGVDGMTAKEFEQDLMGNLKDLVEKLKSGSYKAPPVRRIYLDKPGGGERPIGIPTFSDKVMQRAVTMLLEPIYEQDFHDFSYGSRPQRSAHQAISAMRDQLWYQGGCWVVEIDISGFFDAIDHGKLRDVLDNRVRDGVLRRTIDKWLRAGVMEGECFSRPENGTPQGGVISPLLANIFLHEVMDNWFVKEVRPRMGKAARMVRYADDILMFFESYEAAKKVLEVTQKRFKKYGLEIHPKKSKITDFRKPVGRKQPKKSHEHSKTFDFLGFTFYWGIGRKGFWALKCKTRKKSFQSGLKNISAWCEKHRHFKVQWQHQKLSEKLRGHYGYFGRIGNLNAMSYFRWEVVRVWKYWLNRRSQQRHMPWAKFQECLERNPLPVPKITIR